MMMNPIFKKVTTSPLDWFQFSKDRYKEEMEVDSDSEALWSLLASYASEWGVTA
jgi:hypothetical protein